MDNGWIDVFTMDTDTFWLRQNLPICLAFFLDPFPCLHPLPIHYPLRIRIHYESIIHYVSVYPSIIHHVSLSIILSRLRIHLEAPGRHFGDFVPTLPTFWRFCADIADILVILCQHCRHVGDFVLTLLTFW